MLICGTVKTFQFYPTDWLKKLGLDIHVLWRLIMQQYFLAVFIYQHKKVKIIWMKLQILIIIIINILETLSEKGLVS